jgi:hypothetical protein
MSFDIAKTPTLEAVATADEQVLAQDLRERVAELVDASEQRPEVVEAAESQRAAADRLEKLRVSQRVLNQFAKDARERLAKIGRGAIDAAVASAESGKVEFGKLNELVTAEYHDRYASRALQQIAEHLIPLAHIASLRAESHAMLAAGRALENLAQERAEKLLVQMRDAVTEEMVLPVDLSKGVVGALLSRAEGLKRRAVQISESADEAERKYTEVRR